MRKRSSARLIPFPAYAYAFIQRGTNHTRTLTAWALLQKTRLRDLQRQQVVRMISRRMGVSAKQARLIIRRGEGRFWTVVCGRVYPRSSGEVAALVGRLRLARYIKRSKIYVPEQALKNLGQLRAHLSLPVISRSDDLPTARAYTAVCLGRTRNTVSIYRRWLRGAGFIRTRANYTRTISPEGAWQRGQFLSSEGSWLVQRRPDHVVLTGANIYRVNKGQSPSRGMMEFGDLRYKASSHSVPDHLPTNIPPRAPPTETERWLQELRQENRVKSPRLGALHLRI